MFCGKVLDVEKKIKSIPCSGLCNTVFPRVDKDISSKN